MNKLWLCVFLVAAVLASDDLRGLSGVHSRASVRSLRWSGNGQERSRERNPRSGSVDFVQHEGCWQLELCDLWFPVDIVLFVTPLYV